jgi:allophanate hydrolase subunit 1
MNIKLVNCPYCETEQRVFYLNYNLGQLLKRNFQNHEKVLALRNYLNTHNFVKNFNCNNCNETLTVYFNSETYQYFIQGQRLTQIQEQIKKIRLKIKKLRKKIIITYNQKIIDLLKLEIEKEVKSLNHFIDQDEKIKNFKPQKLSPVVNS